MAKAARLDVLSAVTPAIRSDGRLYVTDASPLIAATFGVDPENKTKIGLLLKPLGLKKRDQTKRGATYYQVYAKQPARPEMRQNGKTNARRPKLRIVQDNDWTPRDDGEEKPRSTDEGCALKYSEEWLALEFAREHSNHLRYVKTWNAWMAWDGKQWKHENTLLAYNLIRRDCRIATDDAVRYGAGGKTIEDLGKAKTRGAVETLARSDRRLAATDQQWDADDWLLNTPEGIVNLRTGRNIGHDPARYCTKITDVTPQGDCPLWKRFLDKVTAGDKDLHTQKQIIFHAKTISSCLNSFQAVALRKTGIGAAHSCEAFA